MLVFPQLETGGSALYPVRSRSMARTVLNTLGDGRTIVFGDTDAPLLGWDLHANGLTHTEWNAIEQLFNDCSGSYKSFTMLDPTGNLLTDSEGFGGSAWTRGALVSATTGVSDPMGGTSAVHIANSGQTTARVEQTIDAPGNFHYCFSVWAKSGAGSGVALAIGSLLLPFPLTAQWKRIAVSSNVGPNTDTISFGVELEAGGSVDLFGAQVEAQLAASDYKKTGLRGGVYRARFASDELSVTATGTNTFDSVIRIVTTKE